MFLEWFIGFTLQQDHQIIQSCGSNYFKSVFLQFQNDPLKGHLINAVTQHISGLHLFCSKSINASTLCQMQCFQSKRRATISRNVTRSSFISKSHQRNSLYEYVSLRPVHPSMSLPVAQQKIAQIDAWQTARQPLQKRSAKNAESLVRHCVNTQSYIYSYASFQQQSGRFRRNLGMVDGQQRWVVVNSLARDQQRSRVHTVSAF